MSSLPVCLQTVPIVSNSDHEVCITRLLQCWSNQPLTLKMLLFLMKIMGDQRVFLI